jgi:putative two-component system response regulator
MKLLIIDDDPINRKLIATYLKHDPTLTLYEAESGTDALNFLRTNPIDLIFLDLLMPVMNGLEFLEIFKAKFDTSHTPIIVLSTDDTQKHTALTLGANDFLTKPIKQDLLLQTLQKWQVV